MGDFMLEYIPANVPLNKPDVPVTSRRITLDNLTTAVRGYLMGRIFSGLRNHDVKINLYDFLFKDKSEPKIPMYSYMETNSQRILNRALEDLFAEYAISTAFERPNMIHGQQIIFKYNQKKGNPMLPGYATTKIHLQVKHEYILHCMLRLTGLVGFLPGFHRLFPENEIHWKVYFWNRDSNLGPEDTELRRVNGGVAATFVIYASSDQAIMRRMLLWLLERFPEHDTYGLMDVTGTDTLTAGHIRLNRMISYASSDRAALLKMRNANAANFSRHVPYVLPKWLRTLQRSCSDPAEANRQSQLFIGRDVCTAEAGRINYKALCDSPFVAGANPDERNFCYMNPDILNPRRFLGMQASSNRSSSARKTSSRSKSGSGSGSKSGRKTSKKKTSSGSKHSAA
jgi:hypothetical protein